MINVLLKPNSIDLTKKESKHDLKGEGL